MAEKGSETKKKCFVISPIGEEGSEMRERSNKVLEHIIKPPVEECGYECMRADEIAEPGIITSQIIPIPKITVEIKIKISSFLCMIVPLRELERRP